MEAEDTQDITLADLCPFHDLGHPFAHEQCGCKREPVEHQTVVEVEPDDAKKEVQS